MSDPSIWREHGTPLLPALGSGPLGSEPLRGRTVAVKDLFAIAGFPTGAGNPTWLAQAEREPRDAWAVRALRAAGAAIAGIAQTDELAFSLSGANLSLTTKRYVLSIYAKNLLDDRTIIQTPEINTVYEGYTVHPLVIGVSVKMSF